MATHHPPSIPIGMLAVYYLPCDINYLKCWAIQLANNSLKNWYPELPWVTVDLERTAHKQLHVQYYQDDHNELKLYLKILIFVWAMHIFANPVT